MKSKKACWTAGGVNVLENHCRRFQTKSSVSINKKRKVSTKIVSLLPSLFSFHFPTKFNLKYFFFCCFDFRRFRREKKSGTEINSIFDRKKAFPDTYFYFSRIFKLLHVINFYSKKSIRLRNSKPQKSGLELIRFLNLWSLLDYKLID